MLPTNQKTISLIIPTWNMVEHVVRLLDAVKLCGLFDILSEIWLVDDGSTDGTSEQVRRWASAHDRRDLLNIEKFPVNRGRFQARLAGAENSRSEYCLFLDARVQLTPDFPSALVSGLDQHSALVVTTQVDDTQSIFNLYWKRTHDRIFARTIEAEKNGLLITSENLKNYIVGTTGFVCKRTGFIEACQPFLGRRLESDDTALLENFIRATPIYRHSSYYLLWEPRQKLGEFLGYIFRQRGISFAEYHLLQRWSWLTWLFLSGVVGLAVVLGILVLNPYLGVTAMIVATLAIAASTALFAPRPHEFVCLAPLHTAVIFAYGFGALFGLFRIAGRKLIGSSNS